jgi:predicted PurR-regulated permease PerM
MTTSSTDPDQLRDQIEHTRAELSSDVNALTEKVSPGRAVSRQVHRTRDALTSMKETIMGTTADVAAGATSTAGSAVSTTTDQLSGLASSAGDTIGAAPGAVRNKTVGNPLAAGLVAFGLGWLVSSLLPASRKEQQLAGQATEKLGEQLQPVAQHLQEAASEVTEQLREPAQQAVESVRSTATDAMSTVADEGRTAADQVAGRTEQARDTVTSQSGDKNRPA